MAKLLSAIICMVILGLPSNGKAQEETIEKATPYGNKQITVVINPGHGGKDPGRLRGTRSLLHEKDINLKIALKLGNYISEGIANTKIIYTRTTDKFISLDETVNIANNANADYFISVHCNSNPNKAIHGTRTHIHSHNFKASRKLAFLIEKQFSTRAGRHSRGVKDARERGYNLQVLQYTKMPGVLVEVGFLTNPIEEKYLNSDYGQSIIASGIFRAFREMISGPPKKEKRSKVYKVQIMASAKPVNLENRSFKKLEMRVEEHESTHKVYKYRYLVGHEYDPSLALKLAEKVKKKGFKDAFVVSLEESK